MSPVLGLPPISSPVVLSVVLSVVLGVCGGAPSWAGADSCAPLSAGPPAVTSGAPPVILCAVESSRRGGWGPASWAATLPLPDGDAYGDSGATTSAALSPTDATTGWPVCSATRLARLWPAGSPGGTG